jgi:hypothetical protein
MGVLAMTASYVNPLDGTGWLTHQDLLAVLGALSDGVRYQEQRMARCAACRTGLVCGLHDDCDRTIVRYRAISRGLGDDR